MTRPDVGVMRELLAAWLLGRDEAGTIGEIGYYAKHFAERLPRWLSERHSGDCTKESHSCARCIAERAYGEADALISGFLAPTLACADAQATALKPFADVADAYERGDPEDYQRQFPDDHSVTGMNDVQVTHGHFRAARTALIAAEDQASAIPSQATGGTDASI
jgi:hypothetical protein